MSEETLLASGPEAPRRGQDPNRLPKAKGLPALHELHQAFRFFTFTLACPSTPSSCPSRVCGDSASSWPSSSSGR